MSKVLFALLFFVLAFDFRGEEAGGSLYQYVIVSVSYALALLLLVINAGRLSQIPKRQYVVSVLLVLLFLISFPISIMNGVAFDRYIRVVTPFFLFVTVFVSVLITHGVQMRFSYVEKILVGSAIVNAIWKAGYALIYLRISIYEMRYQLLSIGTAFILAYSACQFFVSSKSGRRYWWLIPLSVSGIAILMSITRTHLASAGVMLGGVFMYYVLNHRVDEVKAKVGSAIASFVLLAGFVAFVVLPMALYFRPDVIDQWVNRIFYAQKIGVDIDPTGAVRLAQMRGQLDSLIDNPRDILFGRGFGQHYQMSVDLIVANQGFSGRLEDVEFMTGESWVNADSVYTPVLFCGGLSLFIVFLYLIINGLKLIKIDVRSGNRMEYAWVGLVILYFAVVGFFGNFMLDRYGAPLVGAVCALAMIIGEKRVGPQLDLRRTQAKDSENNSQLRLNSKLQ